MVAPTVSWSSGEAGDTALARHTPPVLPARLHLVPCTLVSAPGGWFSVPAPTQIHVP